MDGQMQYICFVGLRNNYQDLSGRGGEVEKWASCSENVGNYPLLKY